MCQYDDIGPKKSRPGCLKSVAGVSPYSRCSRTHGKYETPRRRNRQMGKYVTPPPAWSTWRPNELTVLDKMFSGKKWAPMCDMMSYDMMCYDML